MVCCPWLSKYISFMSAKSEVTLALFKMSMMVSIELWSWSMQPGSVHLIRSFEVSCLHLHCKHVLMMFLPKVRVWSCSGTIQEPVL